MRAILYDLSLCLNDSRCPSFLGVNMFIYQIHRHSLADSRCKGQALVEGTALMVLFIGLFVGLLILFVNISIVVSEQQKIQVAATQASQYIMGQRYWLGSMRTDYDASKAAAGARLVADQVLAALKLPASSSFSTADTLSVNGITVTAVTLSVNRLPLLNGGFLSFPMAASSASSTAQDITQGWRAVSIQCADPINPLDQTQWRTMMVPCYDYFIGAEGSQSSPVPVAKLSGPSLIGHVTILRSGSGPCDILQNGGQTSGSSINW